GGLALTLGKHTELISGNALVLVHAGLQMPALEVAAIGAGKGTGSKTADRRSLPVTVINHALDFRLLAPGGFQRQPERTAPCGPGNGVAGKAQRSQSKNRCHCPEESLFHFHTPLRSLFDANS